MESNELQSYLEADKKAQEETKSAIAINATEVKAAKEELEAAKVEVKATKEELVKLGTEVAKMKEAKELDKKANATLKDTLEEKSFKVGSTLELDTKAVLNFSNLTDNNVFAQVEGGITYLPYVAPKVVNLFGRIPMVTETYSYVDQTAETRAAIMAALCGTGETFTTTESLEAKLINYVKVKDSLDICLDYADDYSFVEQSARFLLETSVIDKIEDQLINGSGTSNEMFSLASYSTEFDDTFAGMPLTDSIADANMADLALGMAAQIEVKGLLNTYMPNVVLVNKGDFFKQIESAKDTQGTLLRPSYFKSKRASLYR